MLCAIIPKLGFKMLSASLYLGRGERDGLSKNCDMLLLRNQGRACVARSGSTRIGLCILRCTLSVMKHIKINTEPAVHHYSKQPKIKKAKKKKSAQSRLFKLAFNVLDDIFD